MKSIVTLLLSLASLQLLAQDRQLVDYVVSKVGDEIILLSDVELKFKYEEERRGYLPEEAKCSFLEQIMGEKLLVNQAKLDSIIVDDGMVEQQLSGRIDQILGMMNNDISQFESYYGKTVAEVRNEMREDLKSQLTAERMQSEVMANIQITPKEVKQYFDEIPKDSLPYFSSEVEVGEIVVNPKVSPEEREKSIKKLEDIRARILAGEDFGELARLYSDDAGSARLGGDLGLQKRGTFVPAFEAAAYNLTEGELSEIIESEFGFHLIELLERRGNLIHTRHILVKPEITEADLEQTVAYLDSIRQIYQTDSVSFEEMVKRYSDEKVQSYNNGGRMLNPATGNTFFETAQLDVDIFFAIDTLEEGEMSAPIEFTKQTGEIVYRVILLQSRTKPHQANLSQDYTKIKNAAIEARKSSYLNDWLEEKVQSTYVEIAPAFLSGCPNLARWVKTKTISP